jgi:hypothetical protein
VVNFRRKSGQFSSGKNSHYIVTGVVPQPNNRKDAVIPSSRPGIIYFCEYTRKGKYLVQPGIVLDIDKSRKYPMVEFYTLHTRGMRNYVQSLRIRNVFFNEIGGDQFEAVHNMY